MSGVRSMERSGWSGWSGRIGWLGRGRRIGLLLGLLGVALGGLGCEGGQDVCEARSACAGHDERETAYCVELLQADAEIAALYGCAEEWDAWFGCYQVNAQCEEGVFRTERCEVEGEALRLCQLD